MRLLQNASDKEAFSELYQRYKAEIYSYFLRNTKKEIAEELMQTTFMKLAEKNHSFKFESKFRTWLWSVARFTLIDFLRLNENKISSAVNESFEVQDLTNETENNIEEILGNKELRSKLKNYIDKLKDEEREVFTLFLYSELSHEEIAKLTNYSVGKIKTIIHRGKNKIMLMFKEDNLI